MVEESGIMVEERGKATEKGWLGSSHKPRHAALKNISSGQSPGKRPSKIEA